MTETFNLPGYQGGNLSFKGRMFAEDTHADEERGFLLRVRMFLTEDCRLVHSIVCTSGMQKYSHTHVLSKENDALWRLDNGREQFLLSREMLFLLLREASTKTDTDLNTALDSLTAVA